MDGRDADQARPCMHLDGAAVGAWESGRLQRQMLEVGYWD